MQDLGFAKHWVSESSARLGGPASPACRLRWRTGRAWAPRGAPQTPWLPPWWSPALALLRCAGPGAETAESAALAGAAPAAAAVWGRRKAPKPASDDVWSATDWSADQWLLWEPPTAMITRWVWYSQRGGARWGEVGYGVPDYGHHTNSSPKGGQRLAHDIIQLWHTPMPHPGREAVD